MIDAGDVPATEKGPCWRCSLDSMERAESPSDRMAQERLSVDRDQAAVLAAST